MSRRSKWIHELTVRLREVDGTRLEPVRNTTLSAIGLLVSGLYGLARRLRGAPTRHPLMAILSRQVGEPFERWDLDDIPKLRAVNEELTSFLPSRLQSISSRECLEPGGMGAVRLSPHSTHTSGRRVLVYLHGGGFVLGSAESVLPEADWLCTRLGLQGLVLDYPLAPESRLEETTEAVRLSLEAISEASDEIILVGESAGGYLIMDALTRSVPLRGKCSSVVLLYPLLDLELDSESVRRLGHGNILTSAILQWFVNQALGSQSGTQQATPRIRCDSSVGDIPVHIYVGEFDPLLEDWKAIQGCVPKLSIHVAPGMMHGFLQMRAILPERQKYLRSILARVQQDLAD